MLNKVAFCLIAILLLAACNTTPETCEEQDSWKLKISFSRAKTVDQTVTIKDSTVRKLAALGENNDSTISFASISSVLLPLSHFADSSVFQVTLNSMPTAKLYIKYKRNEVFESYKCGYRINFVLDTLYSVPQVFDSIVIIQPNITDVIQENCKFYLNLDSTKYL